MEKGFYSIKREALWYETRKKEIVTTWWNA
jgi:hypothetical protein